MQTVREGDTHEVFWRVLDEATQAPLDLTSAAEVVIHIQRGREAPIVLDAEVDGDPTQGRVMHRLTGTLTPGTYALEIQITGAPGIQTAPTRRNDALVVVPQIA